MSQIPVLLSGGPLDGYVKFVDMPKLQPQYEYVTIQEHVYELCIVGAEIVSAIYIEEEISS